MAVRFDARNDYLRRTTNLPAVNTFTMMGWFRILVDQDDYSIFMTIGEANTDNDYEVNTNNDGVTLSLWCNPNYFVGSTALTIGQWYHLALAVSGSGADQAKLYLDGSLYLDETGSSAMATNSNFMVGQGGVDEVAFLNGTAAFVKIYSAVLTQAEIQQEMYSGRPVRTANLNGFYPMWAGSGERAKDYSGNGNDFTEGGTLTDEAGPPIPWASQLELAPWYVAAGGTPITINASAGAAAVDGISSLVATAITINCNVGSVAGDGISSQVAAAVTVNANPGASEAAGINNQVTAAILVNANPGSADIAGISSQIATAITVTPNLGAAAANGVSTSVTMGIIINATVGSSHVAGPSTVIATAIVVNATIGSGEAEGPSSLVAAAVTVTPSLGAAGAAGISAEVSIVSGITINASIGSGLTAGVSSQASAAVTVTANPGPAGASGVSALVGWAVTITPDVGLAQGWGVTAAIAAAVTVSGSVGEAAAWGVYANVTAVSAARLVDELFRGMFRSQDRGMEDH